MSRKIVNCYANKSLASSGVYMFFDHFFCFEITTIRTVGISGKPTHIAFSTARPPRLSVVGQNYLRCTTDLGMHPRETVFLTVENKLDVIKTLGTC